MTEPLEVLIESLSRVAKDGAVRAGRGLSGLMRQEIVVHVPDIREGTKLDACGAVGGEGATVLGAYLRVDGDITAQVMVLFPERRALECVDQLCGYPRGTIRQADDLARSAIAEMGNIVGSAFLNALADYAALRLHPSPPVVIHDMAGAIVESVYAEVLSTGADVVIAETVFEDTKGKVAGLLIVAPDLATLTRLEDLAA